MKKTFKQQFGIGPEAHEKEVRIMPDLFDLSKTGDVSAIKRLISAQKIQTIGDDYEEQLTELFGVQNPTFVYAPGFKEKVRAFIKKLEDEKPLWQRGRWAYYPWRSALVHVLPDAEYQLVRTARNRNLITKEEQKRFYDAVVGIGGLSIGNSVALSIVLQGGARHIRLADLDRLALSNMNRVRAGAENLGLLKVHVTARQIYEINPYARVEVMPDGLTPKNIRKFFDGKPKLDIVIDELDNLAVKYLIREQAKRAKIAVVMAADNGDNAVVDIERYDLKPQPKFFHGRLGKTSYKELANLDKFGIGKTITKHIGPENVTERMQKSLLEMGKTIVSWPQLGGAALLNGSAVAYCVRKIICGEPLEMNRSLLSFDEKLIPQYNSPAERAKRKTVADGFRKIFGL
jgi:predicted ThiF/HesA family dinucleotide-utilizing enzyme